MWEVGWFCRGQTWPIRVSTTSALEKDANTMSIQVSEQPFMLGNRAGGVKFLSI